MAGSDRVEHNQENIGGAVRWHRPTVFFGLFDPVAHPRQRRKHEEERQKHRDTDAENALHAAGVSLAERYQSRGPPPGPGRNRRGYRAAERNHQHWRERKRAAAPRHADPATAGWQEPARDLNQQSGDRENTDVDERNQPDEVATYPVQMIRAYHLFSDDDRRYLEKPRGEPAPRGKRHEPY